MDNRDLHGELHKLLARIDLIAARMQRLQDENFRLKGQVGQMVDDLFTGAAFGDDADLLELVQMAGDGRLAGGGEAAEVVDAAIAAAERVCKNLSISAFF